MKRFRERDRGADDYFARFGQPKSACFQITQGLFKQDIWLLFRAFSQVRMSSGLLLPVRETSGRNLMENTLCALKTHTKRVDSKLFVEGRPGDTSPGVVVDIPHAIRCSSPGLRLTLPARQSNKQRSTEYQIDEVWQPDEKFRMQIRLMFHVIREHDDNKIGECHH